VAAAGRASKASNAEISLAGGAFIIGRTREAYSAPAARIQ
jgi:hypothetical protein